MKIYIHTTYLWGLLKLLTNLCPRH